MNKSKRKKPNWHPERALRAQVMLLVTAACSAAVLGVAGSLIATSAATAAPLPSPPHWFSFLFGITNGPSLRITFRAA